MVNRNLMRQFDAPLDAEDPLQGDFEQAIAEWIGQADKDYEANKIVTGKVVEIRGEEVVIDIGYKSEGLIRIDEWREEGVEASPPKVGDTVEVLLETVEDENGTIS